MIGAAPVNRLLSAVMPGATRRARHISVRNALVAKSHWSTVTTGVLEPFLYLLSVGVGVSVLVGDIEVDGRVYDYTTFVAPAMLASAAMSGAIAESTYNTYGKFKWDNTYEAMTATPLTPGDIALGELLYAQGRGTVYSFIFLCAIGLLGLAESWWALLALPAGMLIGVAFSAVGLAAVTYMRSWEDFDLVLLVQVSLFLFSATFYPLSVYPPALQVLARFSPLYHGAALTRDLILGTVGWADVGHVAVLLAMAVFGLRLASKRFAVLLYA